MASDSSVRHFLVTRRGGKLERVVAFDDAEEALRAYEREELQLGERGTGGSAVKIFGDHEPTDAKMTTDQPTIEIDKVPQLVAEWLRIGYPDKAPTPADAWHSALLQRLLRGAKVHDQAPPRAFSYPWYGLLDAEGGVLTENCSVSIPDERWSVDLQGHIVLNQAPWRVVDTISDRREYVIEWPATGLRCNLRIEQEVSGEFHRCTLVVLPGADAKAKERKP